MPTCNYSAESSDSVILLIDLFFSIYVDIYIRKFYSEDVSSLFSYLEKERGRMASSFSQMFVFLSENGTSIFFLIENKSLPLHFPKGSFFRSFFEISQKRGHKQKLN